MVTVRDRDRITDLLRQVEERYDVKVLMAVESGSRAWGFASPDSDFDVRFVYQEPLERVIRLFPGRDVIEEMTPYHPDGTGVPIDLVGWSLTKTLRLAVASNPQLCEWARGTVTYLSDPEFTPELRRLTSQSSPRVLAHHYRGLAKKTGLDYLSGPEDPVGKKYLYAVRSVLAASWMLDHPTPGSAPPVRFDRLRKETRVPDPVSAEIDTLLRWKVGLGEARARRRFPVLDAWVSSELDRLQEAVPSLPDPEVDREVAEQVLRARVLPAGPDKTAPSKGGWTLEDEADFNSLF
jgi:predicted nucleotidyltransferase